MMKTPIVRKRFNNETSFMINEKCEPQLYELLGEILPPVVVCRFQMIDGENSQQANLQLIFLISQVWVVFSFFENIKYGSPALIVNTSEVVFVIESNMKQFRLDASVPFLHGREGGSVPLPQLEGEMPPNFCASR